MRVIFGPFWVILRPFGPFWTILGHIWATLGHFWLFFGHFVAYLEKFAEGSNFFAAPLGLRYSLFECMIFSSPGEAPDRLVPNARQGDEGAGLAWLRGLCWLGHWRPSLGLLCHRLWCHLVSSQPMVQSHAGANTDQRLAKLSNYFPFL